MIFINVGTSLWLSNSSLSVLTELKTITPRRHFVCRMLTTHQYLTSLYTYFCAFWGCCRPYKWAAAHPPIRKHPIISALNGMVPTNIWYQSITKVLVQINEANIYPFYLELTLSRKHWKNHFTVYSVTGIPWLSYKNSTVTKKQAKGENGNSSILNLNKKEKYLYVLTKCLRTFGRNFLSICWWWSLNLFNFGKSRHKETWKIYQHCSLPSHLSVFQCFRGDADWSKTSWSTLWGNNSKNKRWETYHA